MLEGYGAGLNMLRLIRHFWDEAQMVCCASVLRRALQGRLRCYQGSLLSAKLFNLLVNAVAREWLVRLPQEAAKDHKEEYLAKLMRGFFTTFNVDDAYFAS